MNYIGKTSYKLLCVWIHGYIYKWVTQNDKILLVKTKNQTKTKIQEVMNPNITFSDTKMLVLDQKTS